jgi:YD repeat-containing protein
MRKSIVLLAVLMFVVVLAGADLSTANQVSQRSYPPPVPAYPLNRDAQNIKGPVKSVYSETVSFPHYYSYQEFTPDGKVALSSGGRTSMNSETRYWYDEHGNINKEQYLEYGNGEELTNEATSYEYVYDSLGYPLKKTSMTSDGIVLNVENYVYADTTYYKEWEDEPNEYSPGYTYRETYDGKGRLISWVSVNMSDKTVNKRETVYTAGQNTKIEWSEWNGKSYDRKKVVKTNDKGMETEWTMYDGADRIAAKQTYACDAKNNITSSVYTNAEENSTSRSTYKYTFDKYGNPLSVDCVRDGAADEESSSTIGYEYY